MINNTRAQSTQPRLVGGQARNIQQEAAQKELTQETLSQLSGPSNSRLGMRPQTQQNKLMMQQQNPLSNQMHVMPPNPIMMIVQMLLQMIMSLLSPKQEPETKPAGPTGNEALAKPAAPKAPAGPKGSNEAFAKRLNDTGRSDFTVDGQKYAIVKSDSDSGFSAKKVNNDGSLGKTIDKNVQGPDSDQGVKGFFEVGGIKGVSGNNRAYIGNSDPSGEVKVLEAEAGLDKGHKHREAHTDIVMKSGKELNGGAAALPNASKGAAHALENWTAFETAIQGDRNKADDFVGTNDLQTILDDPTFSAKDKAAAKELLVLANTTGKNGFTKDEVAKIQKAGPVAPQKPLTEAEVIDNLVANFESAKKVFNVQDDK